MDVKLQITAEASSADVVTIVLVVVKQTTIELVSILSRIT